jgi:DNA replication protein DnaC
LLFGPLGGGKSHLAAALGLALVQNGWRVLFMRTTDLVQRLQVARRELGLETAITKLDKYQLLILDDIAYVTKDQAETSVLFELIAARYERRSLLITANQPFGEWGKIFSDQAMTLAASGFRIKRAPPPRLPSRQDKAAICYLETTRIYMPGLQKGFMVSALLHEGRRTCPFEMR